MFLYEFMNQKLHNNNFKLEQNHKLIIEYLYYIIHYTQLMNIVKFFKI